jgi:hypothetical protein
MVQLDKRDVRSIYIFRVKINVQILLLNAGGSIPRKIVLHQTETETETLILNITQTQTQTQTLTLTLTLILVLTLPNPYPNT